MSGLRRIFGSQITKNAMWIIGEQIFQMILSLVIGVISARYLGPSNYGALNYTASFVTFFSSFAVLGMDGIIIKRMIAEPDKEGRYLGGCILLRFISAVLSSVSVIFIVWLLNPDDSVKLVLISIQSIQLIFMAVNIFDSWFQRWLRSANISIAKVLTSIAIASYKIYILLTAKDIRWFAFSNVLSYMILSVVLYISYKKSSSQALKPDIKKGILVLSESYHFIISGVMVAIYGQMDKMMIGGMIDDKAVGLYATAATLCTAWLFIPAAIMNSFRPKIMEIKQYDDERTYKRRLEQLYSLIIWLCLIVSLIICLFGYWVILLLFGTEYLGAVPALRVLIWSEVFSMIGTMRGIWILCEGKQKYVKYYLGIGATLNLVLNTVLIPLFGIVGAALATLITQVFTSLIAPILFKETRVHTKLVFESFLLRWHKK